MDNEETWFEFMDRAKKNRLSPTRQEEIDKDNGFEKREKLGETYWEDQRWEKVQKLRELGEHLEANSLVFRIRDDYGL